MYIILENLTKTELAFNVREAFANSKEKLLESTRKYI